MTLTLIDIPRLLNIVKIYQNKNQSLRSYVQKTFNDEPVRQARFPNYNEIEKFCTDLKLISIDNGAIILNELGKIVLNKYEEMYLIDENFKSFFVKKCLIPSTIGQKIVSTISKFYAGDTGRWFPKDEVYDLVDFPEILPILYELDVLQKKQGVVVANPEYVKLKVEKRLTQKQLDAQLENWKITGAIAEEIALEYEKERLLKEGHKEEANNVVQISQEFANAGYDIESFYYNPETGMEKIFIEVKGTTEKEFDFFWSSNEYQKAKEYGDKYWIYFISEINTKTKTTPNGPFKIQDPAFKIFNNRRFKVEIEKYRIRGDLAGYDIIEQE